MRRRLNYTRRIRISQVHIGIQLSREEGEPLRFTADRELSDYNLPPDAPVFLEAYRGNSYMRFPWGEVAQARSLSSVLTDIDSNDTVYFRVKVVGSGTTNGLILAHADRIKASVSDHSILPVEPIDLDNIIWRLSFDDDEPMLFVNERIEGIMDRTRFDPDFAALVFPAVLREILKKVCEGDDDEQSWMDDWKRFAQGLTSQPIPSQDDADMDEWIEATVNAFSRRHGLLNRYQESLNART